jgi:putative iron-regulated protein
MLRALRCSLPTLLLPLLAACGGGGGGGGDGSPPQLNEALAAQVVQTYAGVLSAAYEDVRDLVDDLDDAVEALLADPSATTLAAAQAAWVAARPFYIQTELGRFYDGPIDRAPDGPEIFVNAWPLDEAHIDYVSGAPSAGYINDTATFPALDEQVLRDLNESGGESNISTGWHAIEFLLWGQDLALGAPAGQRPATDFLADGSGTAANQTRRREVLALLVDMLRSDLDGVRAQWASVGGSYRSELLGLPVVEALGRIMTGMGTLAFGELRGERLLVPFTTKLAEDEHSCFSDTTHQDHLNDVIGIRNAWRGLYDSSAGTRDVQGTGLVTLAESVNPTLAAQITGLLDALVQDLGSGSLIPFESAIQGADGSPGRVALQQVIQRLAEFNTAFSALAQQMGVDITTTL